MAYSDATRVDANTARISDTSSVRTDLRAAVKTFGDSMETIFTTYSLSTRAQQAFRDKVIDLCRYLDVEMNK